MWLYRNNGWNHVLKGAWEEEPEISLRASYGLRVCEPEERGKVSEKQEIFPVENKKVEVIHVRDFTLFVKCKVLHSSSER